MQTAPTRTTRFAPSPTGHLHKGHAYSALLASHWAEQSDARFLLRIEDIDHTRCSAEHTTQIFEDLEWLGLEWELPVRIQSEHREDFEKTAETLSTAGFLYPCFCTRKDIEREIANLARAPHPGDVPLYPGTCRRLSADERESRLSKGDPHSLRLDLDQAIDSIGSDLFWQDSFNGPQIAEPERLGDAIISRKDIGTSYHLAVTHDDALQSVTDVIRGVDLWESTHLHVVLQTLLGYPIPTYHHHELLTDASGNRLAKRDRSITLKQLRESGTTPTKLREELESQLDL
ncbi:MAG: tRNA glutamyl-Q(34) synthetase GluQRS [Verrucomicrobiota bacterium]